MAGRSCSKQLYRVLTNPSRVASALDWRKSTGGAIATLNVHADRIGVVVAHHPSVSLSKSKSTPTPTIPHYQCSLPRGRSQLPEASRRELADLVREHSVCGFVVSWPLQPDTGLAGASCGRTLLALEDLLDSNSTSTTSPTSESSSILGPNRPVCLWNGTGVSVPEFDAFGRSPVYARTPLNDNHDHDDVSNRYRHDEAIRTEAVWEDFARTHWPEAQQQQQTHPHNHQRELETAAPRSLALECEPRRWACRDEKRTTMAA
mmetsp:Transcript_6245/g.17782  ORF Transcript_6245/g.17782 Transcript_6245/m.17782 type:complete len:261 (+) Transcript_6245:364-1146(+)|eukprot:CAMPEP_0172355856 /NCGR_PEP_ID=MMETSP1060-20121228/238_1 /TAXON_ID=37318 /ORGANISM="Pseudo-nitzschia pungens, Strain cf. cingulata" /LENGTH=260 /DNA_ID=CAMNT_0013075713 /DNA_START=292 /DNA_END=1074 /DNA_ORIENTATION=-